MPQLLDSRQRPRIGWILRQPGLVLAQSLGLAACNPALLEENGPQACPANSQMGSGSALAEVPLDGSLHLEAAKLAVFAGPSPNGYLQLLVSAVGRWPVAALVVLSGELLPGQLIIAVPPIPAFLEGPYVALVAMHLTLGGDLTYYEHVHGRSVAYHPAGIGLPRTCPRGGFPFAASFAFLDGQNADAHATVACPRR